MQIETFLQHFEFGLGLRFDHGELCAGRVLFGSACAFLFALAIDPLPSRHHAGDPLHVLGRLARRGLFFGALRTGQVVQSLLGPRQFLLPLGEILAQGRHRTLVELDVKRHKRHRGLAGVDLRARRIDQFLNPRNFVAGTLDLGAVEDQIADSTQTDPQGLQRSCLVSGLAHGVGDVGQFRQEIAGQSDAKRRA